MRLRNGFLSALGTFIRASQGLVLAQQDCEALKNLKLEHATVVSATLLGPTPLKQMLGSRSQLPDVSVPSHCEVRAIARPTSDSEMGFTVWLPPSRAWNGKYMQRGNGGWAGSVDPVSLFASLRLGYAVSGTDDGHHGEARVPDASWAIGHPEKLVDFGYRAVHETAVLSKALLDEYYGKPAVHAYFLGCSEGGREALMEAERYPEDFNGIIAGAPQTTGRTS
jgi:feruloyl esterase